uniref:17-beta-hydroxysteroid dehydrogenase type 6 n=1 Tax=Panagrolaimus sp. PS1159 TaxID=55785 RepID=A0AC35G7E6_9BILA
MISIIFTILSILIILRILKWRSEKELIERISGRYVLISGCDSGFGRRLVERLLMKGMNVFAGCFTDEGEKSLQNDCSQLPGKLYTVSLDITSQKSVDNCFAFVSQILKENESKLWALVNNAGFLAVYGPMDWIGIEEYEQSVGVNLLGAIRMTKKFTQLIKISKGRIVTMISASGRLHGFYTAPYVAAKFGLEGYVDNLRLEMKPFGIKVSIIEPGAFKTTLMNPDAMIRRVESVWSKLSEDVRDEYGDDFKDNYIQSFNAGTSLVANRNIDIVTDAYIHALCAKSPRARYVCGWDAKYIFIPMSFMPSTWQDFLLQLMMNITSGSKLPAALMNNNTLSINNNPPQCPLAPC